MPVGALTKIGKYQIRGTLGKGAMGIVYDGFDPIIERRVAIKTIAKAAMDPAEAAELIGRFRREAQATGRLSHPSIISIHDYGEDDGLAFIAMEYVKGKELRKYFDSHERFDLQRLVRIMGDVLDALEHAHLNGVVHRDIKPGNILITDEGRVKVADFGIARIESSMMTQVGTRIGTPAYMSPEQHQGLPVTGRSDLFSAGVILYQFLTGERPFSGEGYALIHQILLRNPTPPSEINWSIPRALDTVTMKALAKRPEDRFASAREFAEALREAAKTEPVRSHFNFGLDDEMLLPGSSQRTMRLPVSPGATLRTGTASSIYEGSAASEVLLEAELVYWKEIQNSTEEVDFEMFLQVFPDSRFAPLARRRIARIEADTRLRRDAVDRPPQDAVQQAGSEANRTVRSPDVQQVQPPVDKRRSWKGEVATASDQTVGKLEHEVEETPRLVDVVAQRSLENTRAAEPARHATGTPRKRGDAREFKGRGIEWISRCLDYELPRLMARPMGRPNGRLRAMDISPPIIGQRAAAGNSVPLAQTASGRHHNWRRDTKPAHTMDSPVPPYSFSSSGATKPSWLSITAAVVAVLMATSLWHATRSEITRIITADRPQIQTELPESQHQAQVPEEQMQTADGDWDEEKPNPEEVARLVEEQGERDEVARIIAEQRKEQEALVAERNGYLRRHGREK